MNPLMIRTRTMLPDPNDEMVLETAINGCADAIVTFNDRDCISADAPRSVSNAIFWFFPPLCPPQLGA
jgi:predicted nucleic acid-binding protein